MTANLAPLLNKNGKNHVIPISLLLLITIYFLRVGDSHGRLYCVVLSLTMHYSQTLCFSSVNAKLIHTLGCWDFRAGSR